MNKKIVIGITIGIVSAVLIAFLYLQHRDIFYGALIGVLIPLIYYVWFIFNVRRPGNSVLEYTERFLAPNVQTIKDILQGEIIVINDKQFSILNIPCYVVKGFYKDRKIICVVVSEMLKGQVLGSLSKWPWWGISINFSMAVNAVLNKKFFIDYPKITPNVRFYEDRRITYTLLAETKIRDASKFSFFQEKLNSANIALILEELYMAATRVESDPKYRPTSFVQGNKDDFIAIKCCSTPGSIKRYCISK